MRKRLARAGALVLAAVLLLSVVGQVGCGENGEAKKTEIIIGILTDFTGPAAYAVGPTVDAFMDAFTVAEEEGSIPEVRIKFITYDNRTDYARNVPGYLWLKGQGTTMMYIMGETDRRMLATRFGPGEMPVFGSGLDEELPDHEWIYSRNGSVENQVEIIMQYVMATWDYAGEGRSPRFGHLGTNLGGSMSHQIGVDRTLEAYPDKFDFVGVERTPIGSSTFAGEINKLKDSDYILISSIGGMTASFMREARARGYQGAFLSGMYAFPGFWDLVKTAVPADQLYDCYHAGFYPWWNQDIPFINSLKGAIQQYHAAEAAARLRNSGPIGGWGVAVWITDVINRAIETVGAENVDGPAIRDAMAATDLTVEGWDNPWRPTADYHALVTQMKVYRWSIAADDWEDTGAGWITPHSLQ